jgi:hypothetical protein
MGHRVMVLDQGLKPQITGQYQRELTGLLPIGKEAIFLFQLD